MLERIKPITALVDEMLDQLPQDMWTDPTKTFLDPAMGGGQFLAGIERRLRAAGHTDENIKSRVFGFEYNLGLVHMAISINKLVATCRKMVYSEYFKWDGNGMKFDCIVGNPPYQKSGNDAKRWTLWDLFVKKSFSLANTVVMITPQSITSPGPFDLIKTKATVINIDVSKHFNVGSTFAYFVANSSGNSTKTLLITSQETFTKNISDLPFLPASITEESLTQIDYLLNRSAKKWKRGELHTSNKDIFTVGGKYSVMHTNAQELQTDIEHSNKDKIRVGVSLSGYPTFRVINGGYLSQACFWTEFSSLKEATTFADECNGEYIQSILKIFKWSGWNSKEVIQCL